MISSSGHETLWLAGHDNLAKRGLWRGTDKAPSSICAVWSIQSGSLYPVSTRSSVDGAQTDK